MSLYLVVLVPLLLFESFWTAIPVDQSFCQCCFASFCAAANSNNERHTTSSENVGRLADELQMVQETLAEAGHMAVQTSAGNN